MKCDYVPIRFVCLCSGEKWSRLNILCRAGQGHAANLKYLNLNFNSELGRGREPVQGNKRTTGHRRLESCFQLCGVSPLILGPGDVAGRVIYKI